MSNHVAEAVKDKMFNQLISTGRPWAIAVALFSKYGISPLIMGCMAYGLYLKDVQGRQDQQQLIQLIREDIASRNELVKAIRKIQPDLPYGGTILIPEQSVQTLVRETMEKKAPITLN